MPAEFDGTARTPGERLDVFLSGAAPTPVLIPVRAERTTAMAAQLAFENPNVLEAQRQAATATRKGSANNTQLLSIQSSAELTDSGRMGQIAALRTKYDAALLVYVESQTEHVKRVRALVMMASPDFAPTSAADASWTNGIMADVDAMSPDAVQLLAADTIARGNLSLAKRLYDKLSGFVTWKKAYMNVPGMSDVLSDLANTLATPDVIRSEAAAELADALESDVRYHTRLLRNGDGYLDPLNITVGTMPILFPDRVFPV
jgi:hypothetical protein